MGAPVVWIVFEEFSPSLHHCNNIGRHIYHIISDFLLKLELQHTKHTKYTSWNWIIDSLQGAVSIRKTVLPGMAIPMLKIRRPNGRLIFNMEIAIRR